MKILGFMGSPRKGHNTDVMLQAVLDGAREQGADTELFILQDHTYGQCIGCNYCKQHEGQCVLKDDMQTFYRAIRECDAFVIASPVYMGQMTGICKIFYDRLYAFMKLDFSTHLKPGIRVLAAYTQGQPAVEIFQSYFKWTNDMLGFLKYEPQKPLVIGGLHHKGELEKLPEELEKAREAGRALAGKA